MKTVYINARFLTRPTTGVERYAREMINALLEVKQERYRFVLVVHRGPLLDPLVKIEVLQDDSLLTGHLWEQIRLPYLAWKHNADLLWSPCNVGPVFGGNHVVTIHDASVFACRDWFSKSFGLLYRLILPMLGRFAKKIITVSSFSKAELIKYGVVCEDNLGMVPEGVNSRFFSSTSPSSFERPFAFPYVLAMGWGDPRKNIKRLICAWSQLSQEEKGGRKLVVLGRGGKSFAWDGPGGFPEDVHSAGFVDDKNLPFLYSGAEAFVYPPLYEGFGLPALEAMACGCPVVTSHEASLPEVCGEAAYYVDPYKTESIARGIQAVLSEEGLKQSLISKGFQRIKQFTWERSAHEMLNVFSDLLPE
jgi:glycosyltransferase involved in cell wall biosynthesis